MQNFFKLDKSAKPVIFGLGSTKLSGTEKKFFQENNPFGFILFSRNIQTKKQVQNLVSSLKETVGRDCPILIDQEGGRVQRLKPPITKQYPPALFFGQKWKENKNEAKKLALENYKNIAKDLREIGINTNCIPVLDILFRDTTSAIGDRSFGNDIEAICELGNIVCEALASENIFPIIKHIPGHGRATLDSHLKLPVVNTSKEELTKADFVPFKQLNHKPLAMVAHILYQDIDPLNPATLSKKVISVIRNEIGFRGMLFTDDISMKALHGDVGDSATKALQAGCDIVLHCNGKMAEMKKIVRALEKTS